MKPVLLVFIALIITALRSYAQPAPLLPATDSLKKNSEAIKEANRQRISKTEIQHFVIKADSNTYGYSIYLDGNLYIHQATIPAIPGQRGFATADQAKKAALLAIGKIKQGELPPTLTEEELRTHKLIQ